MSLLPCVASGVDDVVVGFETRFERPVGAQILPDVSTGFSSGEREGSKIGVMFFRHIELSGRNPSGAVEQPDACAPMATWREIHRDEAAPGRSVGEGRAQRRALPARRTIAPKR